jgi:hypothetical protein
MLLIRWSSQQDDDDADDGTNVINEVRLLRSEQHAITIRR